MSARPAGRPHLLALSIASFSSASATGIFSSFLRTFLNLTEGIIVMRSLASLWRGYRSGDFTA